MNKLYLYLPIPLHKKKINQKLSYLPTIEIILSEKEIFNLLQTTNKRFDIIFEDRIKIQQHM